jgi:hypothetical protein
MTFDFAAFVRSEKCAKSIGWFKFTACILLIVALIFVAIFLNSVLATIRKSMGSSSQFSKFLNENIKLTMMIHQNLLFYLFLDFTIFLLLFVLFLIFYAVCTFVLIIGTVNVSAEISICRFLLNDKISFLARSCEGADIFGGRYHSNSSALQRILYIFLQLPIDAAAGDSTDAAVCGNNVLV